MKVKKITLFCVLSFLLLLFINVQFSPKKAIVANNIEALSDDNGDFDTQQCRDSGGIPNAVESKIDNSDTYYGMVKCKKNKLEFMNGTLQGNFTNRKWYGGWYCGYTAISQENSCCYWQGVELYATDESGIKQTYRLTQTNPYSNYQ